MFLSCANMDIKAIVNTEDSQLNFTVNTSKKLSNPNLTPEQKQAMLGDIASSVAISLGYMPASTKLIYTEETGADNEQIKGHYSMQTNTSYINDKHNDSTTELVSTTGHEIQHSIDAQANIKVTNKADNEIYATNFGNTVADYTNYALGYTDNQLMADTNNHNGALTLNSPTQTVNIITSPLLTHNNNEFTWVDKGLGENLTIFVHGTYASPKTVDKAFINALSTTYNEEISIFDWSGKDGAAKGDGADNSTIARSNAASRLSDYVEDYPFKEGEQLNIIGHSHGGNVEKAFTNLYEGDKKIDNMIFLGTPVRDDYQINYNVFDKNAKIINVYDSSDMAQRLGGSDIYLSSDGLKIDKIGIGGRTIDNKKVINIQVESPNYGTVLYPFSVLNLKEQLLEDHSNLDTKNVWKQINDKE